MHQKREEIIVVVSQVRPYLIPCESKVSPPFLVSSSSDTARLTPRGPPRFYQKKTCARLPPARSIYAHEPTRGADGSNAHATNEPLRRPPGAMDRGEFQGFVCPPHGYVVVVWGAG